MSLINVVIIVEVVNSNNFVAALQKPQSQCISNESNRSCNKYLHISLPAVLQNLAFEMFALQSNRPQTNCAMATLIGSFAVLIAEQSSRLQYQCFITECRHFADYAGLSSEVVIGYDRATQHFVPVGGLYCPSRRYGQPI
jgi:hypothetical protein